MAFCHRLWAEVFFQNHVCDVRGYSALLQVCTPSGRTTVETQDFFVKVFPNLVLPEDLIKWSVSTLVYFAKLNKLVLGQIYEEASFG